MTKRILVINAHPDRMKHHLCTAFAEAYVEGASHAGHSIRRIDLAGFEFPMLHSQDDFEHGTLPEPLKGAARDIAWAEHLVLIFPLWLGMMPALLKAFLEQVARPGVAFEYASGGLGPRPLLKGRSARLIVTMGMPALVYRLWYRSHGVAGLRRSILNFVGIHPVRQTFFGMIDQAGEDKRKQWIAAVQDLGRIAR